MLGVKNSSDKNKDNLTSTSTITEIITEEQLDLSAYEGSPDVNGKISLTRNARIDLSFKEVEEFDYKK